MSRQWAACGMFDEAGIAVMYGHITKFDERLQVGVIATNDGRKFRFNKDQVVNQNGRLVGHEVDFLVRGARPLEIILLTGSPWQVFQHG